MTKAYLLLCLICAFACRTTLGQDYDADSIHYTKIPQFNKTAHAKKYTVLKDTVKRSQFIQYYFQVNTGASICLDCLTGKEFNFMISSVHGVTIGRKFRVGAGAGFESYPQWQTLPLFGNLAFDVFGTKNAHAVFVQGQYGWAHAWHDEQFEYNLKEVNGGQYLGSQLGYRIKYYDLRISFMLGYKKQTVSSYFEYPNWRTDENGLPILMDPNTLTIKRQMERFTITVGLGWK